MKKWLITHFLGHMCHPYFIVQCYILTAVVTTYTLNDTVMKWWDDTDIKLLIIGSYSLIKQCLTYGIYYIETRWGSVIKRRLQIKNPHTLLSVLWIDDFINLNSLSLLLVLNTAYSPFLPRSSNNISSP